MNSPVMDRAQATSMAGDSFRLNLGGRETKIPGFLTVDLFEGDGVDVRSDCSELAMFKDGSVDEIYASHILEHWPHPETLRVLKEWRRVLKKGSRAYIAVPDFDGAMKIVQKHGFTDFIRNLLWGDQGYSLAYHYAGFTFPFLAALLVKAGFEDVKRLQWMPYGLPDCSRNVDSYSHIPISLNVEATA